MFQKFALFFALLLSLSACSPSQKVELTEEEQFALLQEAGTPGAGHRALEPLVGSWDASVKFWFAPDVLPQSSKGVSSLTWVLDGRFLQETFEDYSKEHPFRGFGLIGYDNVKEKYVSVWTDTMSTSLMIGEGAISQDKKQITFTSTYVDPISKEERKTEGVITIQDKDNYTYNAYDTTSSNKKFQMLEVVYKRQKKS